MKRGRLSKSEVEFITANRTMSVEELSKKLNRSTKTIQKVLDNAGGRKNTGILKQMKGSVDNVVVMTPGVSEQSDSLPRGTAKYMPEGKTIRPFGDR